jgi:hypothetical protein
MVSYADNLRSALLPFIFWWRSPGFQFRRTRGTTTAAIRTLAIAYQSDLERLHRAGWELGVLQGGPSLSQRGQTLLEGIERINGRGFVHLS